MLFTLAVPGLVFSMFQCPSVSQRSGPHAVFSLFSPGISFCTNPVSLAHTIAFLSFCFHSLIPDLTTPPMQLSPYLQSSLHAAPTSLLLCLCSSLYIPVLNITWLLCLSKYIKICVQSGSQGLGALVKLHLQEDLFLLVVTCPCQHLTFISELWVSAFPCKLYSRNV